jgi:hypothetical protein
MSKIRGGFKNSNCGPSLKYGYIPCNDEKHISPEELKNMSTEEIEKLDPSKVGKYMKMYIDDNKYYESLGQDRSKKSLAISNLIARKSSEKINTQLEKYNENKPENFQVGDHPDEREWGGSKTRRRKRGRKSRKKGRKSRKSRKSRK